MASWSSMAQVLRTVSPSFIESTSDVWLMASPALPPQRTQQATIGGGWAGRGWALRAELFFKQMRDVEEYSAQWDSIYYDPLDSLNPFKFVNYQQGVRSWENEVALGEGRAVGLELFVEKTAGRTTGWASWTLGRSERRFAQLNEGEWFAARFDRLHHFKMVVLHQVSKHFSLSANWQLASGDAISSLYSYYSNSPVPNQPTARPRLLDLHQGNLELTREGYGDFRQPWQHRLDVSAVWQWAWGRSQHQLSVGAYNAYARRNTHFTYWLSLGEEAASQKQEVKGLPLLPHLTWGVRF